jgi:hypothetical protein
MDTKDKQDNVKKQIDEIQDNFYTENSKNKFFKKKQKIECAQQVVSKLDINTLIEKTVYVIPNTYTIYFDYTIYKGYAHPDIYEYINNHFIQLLKYCVDNFKKADVQVNMDSFTISAFERYKPAIMNIIKNIDDATFNSLNKLIIFNAPSMIETIIQLIYKLLNSTTVSFLQQRLTIIPKSKN